MGPLPTDEAGINERDSEILRVIEEELTGFTFEGLKRRIGAHPETLSRALDRLEERDILERAEGGYRVTSNGRNWLNVHPLSSAEQRLTLVRTLLPPNMPRQQVFADLKGRWFGPLRWLGYSDTPNEVILKWVTADGRVQLDARLSEGELAIEGRLLSGEDMASAVRASHQLMAHISRASWGPRSGHVLMFSVTSTSLMPN